MMQSKLKSIFKAGIPIGLLVIGVVAGMIYLSQIQQPIIQTTMNQKKGIWEPLGDYNPGTGKSGFLCAYIYPHAAVPAVTYAANLSNATAYEYRDSTTGEMNKSTPYNTLFDFVVKYRLNGTDGYNNSALAWTLLWSYINMSVNFNWTADIVTSTMTDVQITTSGTYIWINAYLNNAGAGYSIGKNEKFKWNISGYVYR